MSYDGFIQNLITSGNVSKGAIVGLDGVIWGKSENFNIQPDEALEAAKGFEHLDALLGSGLKFEKVKYFVLNADKERVIGKQGPNGFFLYKTNLAVIVSIYEGGVQPEMCSKATGALADYFIKINY